MDLAAIIALPASLAENKHAAFAPVAGEAPLVRTVRLMLDAIAETEGVIVATAQALVEDARESLAAQGLSTITVVNADGSGAWADCLAAGLTRVGGTRYVLVHDIRRSLASAGVRDQVIAALRAGSSVVMPTQPVTDSVKEVNAAGSVLGTVDRSTLRTIAYPRGFAAEQLADLLARNTSGDLDELAAAMAAGVPITLVEGR